MRLRPSRRRWQDNEKERRLPAGGKRSGCWSARRSANRIRDCGVGGRNVRRDLRARKLLIRGRWYISASRAAAADNPVKARRKGEVNRTERGDREREGGEVRSIGCRSHGTASNCCIGNCREQSHEREPIRSLRKKENRERCRHPERNKRPCLINAWVEKAAGEGERNSRWNCPGLVKCIRRMSAKDLTRH